MTDKPYPFTPEQEAWLRDLETTKEPQTIEWLHVVEPLTDDYGEISNPIGFCCLGRACVVLGLPEVRIGNLGRFDNSDAMLTASMVERLRLHGSMGEFLHNTETGQGSLTELNDDGWSFKAIAAYIRANPENVFLPPEEDKA